MSHDEKLQFIDRELRRLQAHCLKSGYSASQVEQSASCFFQVANKARREKWLKRMIGAGVVVLLCGVVMQFRLPFGFVAFILRSAQIKTLTLWDWTEVYQSNCLLTNPLYSPPDDLTLQHCQICESVEGVERVEGVSGEEVMERFWQRDLPVLMEGGLNTWHNLSLTTPRHVAKLFERSETLQSTPGCAFTSNLASQYGGHRSFLHHLLTRDFPPYFAHWENCEGRAGKVLRTVFPRLGFLPLPCRWRPTAGSSCHVTTEAPSLNSLMVRGTLRQVEMRQPLMMVVQISGHMDIRLEARKPCHTFCPLLHLSLQPGQVLMVTEFLWKLSYLPSSDGESLAVGLGGSF